MASLGTSFSTSGATPNKPRGSLSLSVLPTTSPMTPQSKALSSFASGSTPQYAVRATQTPTQAAYGDVGTKLGYGSSSIPSTGQLAKPMAPQSAGGSTGSYAPSAPSTSSKSSSAGLLPATQSAQPAQPINVPPAQPAQPAPTAEQKNATYGGIIERLANPQPSAQYTDLSNRAAEAYKTAADTNYIIQKSQADVLHNPNYSLDTGIGRAGQIAQNYGLIGQNALTQAQGLGTLAGLANTQQGLQQSAITSAGGLASPIQVSYSNQLLNPATGQPVNPASAQSMQDAVNLQVQKLRAGTTDPASAAAALSAYGQAGTNALQQALGVGFNPNIASANQSSAADLTQQASQLKSTFNGVEANYELLLNTAKQGGVNDTTVPALNALQQNVQRGLASNEAVINFRNTLAAVRAGYAQILGGGTTTVDSQNRAQEAIPDNISLGALISLGEQLKSEAGNRIAGINQQIQSLTSQQGPTSGAPSGGDIFAF